MNKKFTGLVLGLLCTTVMMGQSRNEFSLFGAGGLSTLNYDLEQGDLRRGLGGSFGLGYSFFFSDHWGLGTGVELGFYNSKARINDYHGHYESYYGRMSHFRERQHAMFVNIPLMLQYQTAGKHRFFAAAGAKLAIPAWVKYNTNGDRASLIYTNITDQTLVADKFREKIDDFKTTCLVSAEAGVKWRLTDRMSLYTGAYFDYGVTNVAGKQDKEFLSASSIPGHFATNGVMSSQVTDANGTNVLADKIHPMALGVKVRLSFGFGKRFDERAVVTETVIVGAATPPRTTPVQTTPPTTTTNRPAATTQARPSQQETETLRKPVNGYEIGVYDLSSTQRSLMDQKITLLKKYPNLKVKLVGNTCDIAGEQVNERLGLHRAETVRDYLVSQGIANSRISVESDGKDKPLVPNTNDANRKINRRVDFVINQ